MYCICMKRFYCLIFSFLLFFHLVVYGQCYDGSNWMASLKDDILVSSLSIPGAHDAATGEGMYALPGLGVTQELGLRKQWESGVRAFDLRPAVRGTVLHIYHGRMRTNVSFEQAIDTICMMLERCPGEFAVVLLREETDSEDNDEHALWPSLVGETIARLGEKAAYFAPDMRVRDVRGKIVFLTRNAYTGTDKGAEILGWRHSCDGNSTAKIRSYCNGSVARLQVQDFYAPTSEEKREAKLYGVKSFMEMAEVAPEGVFTINFLSGYATTLLGCTPIATTSGYKLNATWLHPKVLDILSEKTGKNNGNLGVVFMDFAGVDNVGGNLFRRKGYDVYGAKLVRAVIQRNL